MQIVDVKIGNTTVKVLNVHMEAFYPETRERQSHVVRQAFEKYANEMPVLLIGDFNSEAPWVNGADEVMQNILSATNIVSAINERQWEFDEESYYTSSTGDPNKMIDFILYNDNFIEKIEAHVVQEAGDISDHFPVVMRFKFKSRNQPEISE